VSGPAPFAAFWGGLVVVLGIGLAIWSGGISVGLLLAQAGVAVLALGLLQVWRRPGGGARLLPRFSLPTVLLALGGAAAAVGLTAGLWLVLVGGELALFGAVWLGREMRQERQAARALGQPGERDRLGEEAGYGGRER
jgi:hypothetical protein